MERKYFLYILVGAFIVVVATAAWMYYKPHPSVKAAAPAFTLSASELIEAFTNDEANANVLYGGEILEVNGKVKEVLFSDSSVVLQLGDGGEMVSVSCYLQEEGRAQYTSLQHGKSVTVKGICNGFLLDVVLDKCVLLPEDE